MSDLVKTLRDEADGPNEPKFISGKTLREAAARIEALEAALHEVRDWILYELPAGTTRATANLIIVEKALGPAALTPKP